MRETAPAVAGLKTPTFEQTPSPRGEAPTEPCDCTAAGVDRMASLFPRTNTFEPMSDPTDVQEYLKRENERRRGDSDDDGDDDSSNSRISGGIYGGGSWDRSDEDRFGGYMFNGV